MGFKALRFDERGVKAARQHHLLKGKKMLGRGTFAAVYEGTREDTVLKLTVDEKNYWMHNDGYCRVRHQHFPRTVANEGEIGTTRIAGREFGLYLFELERLHKLRRGGSAKKLAAQICEVEESTTGTARGADWVNAGDTYRKLAGMATSTALPPSVCAALDELADFTANVEGCAVDMHSQNFMERDDGTLVMSDPILDVNVWGAAQSQVVSRGW